MSYSSSSNNNNNYSSTLAYLSLVLLVISSHQKSQHHQVQCSSLQATNEQRPTDRPAGRLVQPPPQPQPSASQKRQQQQQQPATNEDDEYLVGVGIADITGPAADINLMGYAKPNQDAGGIHLRQFSRAIVVEDQASGERLVYASLDNGMISQLLRIQVLRRLRDHYGPLVYNESNVMLSATHSHSCPGGFFQYMLYNIPSAGYIQQTLEALVDGVVRSIGRAHDSLQPARIYFAQGELLDASVNRSPTSYANNPAEERARYPHDTDKQMAVLKFVGARSGEPLAMLNWFAVHGTSMNNTNHLISSDNKGYAALLFERDFNPPGTLPGRGPFVAIFAQANEGDVSPNTRGPRCVDTGLPCDPVTSTCGQPPRNEKCIASGPGRDMFESTKIIAYKQYYRARQLFLEAERATRIRGPIRFAHEHIDITKQQVPAYESVAALAGRKRRRLAAAGERRAAKHRRDSSTTATTANDGLAPLVKAGAPSADDTGELMGPAVVQQPPAPTPTHIAVNSSGYQTCVAALGYSFAAGTTDGPGAFDFQQGDTASGRYWNMVRDFLRKPSADQVRCHHPKPVLLSTGEMDFPYMWHPKVVPTQIVALGQLAIVGLPGEFTTMAGRRVREAVRQTLQSDGAGGGGGGESAEGAGEPLVVLSGLSNIYTSYITTIEEYELQRYEGASTLYGPHTLQAYINQFVKLAKQLGPTNKSFGAPSDSLDQHHHHQQQQQQQDDRNQLADLQPPDLTKSLFTLKAGVIFDGAPHGKTFGQLLQDVDPGRAYRRGRDQVSVAFVAGNPRNDLKQEQSFLYVDRFNEPDRSWTAVASDASWETKFIWERTNTLFGESRATIQWDIPADCQVGVYRIRHYGAHKSLLHKTVGQYSGKSSPFKVISGDQDVDSGLDLDGLPPSESSNGTSSADSASQALDRALYLALQLESLEMSNALNNNNNNNNQDLNQPNHLDGAQAKAELAHEGAAKQHTSMFTPIGTILSNIIHWRWK